MKTYYAIVDVEDRRLGTYVTAENVAAAFETATARYQTRRSWIHVETIAVQEIARFDIRFLADSFEGPLQGPG
jgi:hypothetical protein